MDLDGQISIPVEKKYHYFLSHEKQHSKHGTTAGQVAKRLHADLRERGFTGKLNMGDVETIAPEHMRSDVDSSCTMIVCLHDETMRSSWCVEEWRAAIKAGIPIQCVVDQRCSTRRETMSKFDQFCETVNDGAEFQAMKTLQWIQYTDQHRDASVRLLEFFLRDANVHQQTVVDAPGPFD
jgi:hypothetical protein